MPDPKTNDGDAPAVMPRPDERPVPRNAAPPAAGRNFKLNCSLGPYQPNDVVPGYVVEVGHDAQALLERGLVERTDAPTTVNVRPPTPRAAGPTEDMTAERNRLAADADRQLADNKTLAAKCRELEAHRDALKAELGTHVEEKAHLTRACEEHQAALAGAEAEVERLKARGGDGDDPPPHHPAPPPPHPGKRK